MRRGGNYLLALVMSQEQKFWQHIFTAANTEDHLPFFQFQHNLGNGVDQRHKVWTTNQLPFTFCLALMARFIIPLYLSQHTLQFYIFFSWSFLKLL